MPKSKGRKKGKKTVTPYPQDKPALNNEQQQQLALARAKLDQELEEIQNGAPKLPPPPDRHVLVNEVHRDAEDPNDTWLKITCRNCAFLVFSKYRDVTEKLAVLSDLCAAPFGSRSDAEEIVRKWQEAVDRAYDELMAKKTVIDVDDQEMQGKKEAALHGIERLPVKPSPMTMIAPGIPRTNLGQRVDDGDRKS